MHKKLKLFLAVLLVPAVLAGASAWDDSPFMTQQEKNARAQAKADSISREAAKHQGPGSTAVGNSMIDPRDSHIYAVMDINGMVIMAEDLTFEPGSICEHDEDTRHCKKARYYTWKSAQVACPDGWHLPTSSELANAVFHPRFDNTRQNHGLRKFNGDFHDVGSATVYWTSDEDSDYADYGYFWTTTVGTGWEKKAFYKDQAYSVRCVKGESPNKAIFYRTKSKASSFNSF